MLRDLAPATVATFRSIAAAGNDQQSQSGWLHRTIDKETGLLDLADGADMKAIGLHRIGDFQVQLDAFSAWRSTWPQANEFLGISGQKAKRRLGLRRAGCQRPRNAKTQ